MEKLNAAILRATQLHTGQYRKVSKLPYIVHPLDVMTLVAKSTSEEHVLIAAVMHDTVEDTSLSPDQLISEFGERVHNLVMSVSDVSKPEDGNRAFRKAKDLAHYAKGDADAQTIKLCDRYSNLRDLMGQPISFRKKYLSESTDLLNALTKGHELAYERLYNRICELEGELHKLNIAHK